MRSRSIPRMVRGTASRRRYRRLRVACRDRSPVPIAAGEGECGRESFRPLIDRRVAGRISGRYFPLRVYGCGLYPPHAWRKSARRLCNHCYTSPLTVAASIHWLATCRDAFVFEDCVEDSPPAPRTDPREDSVRERLDGSAGPPRFGRHARRNVREESIWSPNRVRRTACIGHARRVVYGERCAA